MLKLLRIAALLLLFALLACWPLLSASACYDWQVYTCSDAPNRPMETGRKNRLISADYRTIQGDIYDPGTGRPIQLRNTARQIIATVEPDGTGISSYRTEEFRIEGLPRRYWPRPD